MMESTLEQYQKVYGMLEDEQSKDIYLNRLNYLISNNKRYIDAIVSAYLPMAPLKEDKTIFDLRNSMPANRKIVFYGAGTVGKAILPCWQDDERVIGFCSRTKKKQENGYCGYPVISPEELFARKDLSVVISTTSDYEEIDQILRDNGYPEDQIYNLSKYFRYEDRTQYFSPSFMAYEDEEVFLDVGCCNLNSTMELRKHCKHLKKVYAFEPDPISYEICVERKERYGLKEVELLPLGAWSEQAILPFESENNGGSNICETGSLSVAVAPIDEVVAQEDRITMIKMDIEGAELRALKGAQQTIRRDKPKLAICIYHKPEDMIDIPLYIKELVPEYKLYIRHHSNDIFETVLYAVMPG